MFDQAQGKKGSKTDSILDKLSVNSDLLVLMFEKTNFLPHKQKSWATPLKILNKRSHIMPQNKVDLSILSTLER